MRLATLPLCHYRILRVLLLVFYYPLHLASVLWLSMSIFSALCCHPPSWRLLSILWVLRSTTYLSTVLISYFLRLDSTPALRKSHPAAHHGLALTWEAGDAQALTPQFKNQSSDDGFRHDTTVESWVCRPMLSSLFPGRKPGPASDTCDPGTCLFAANLPCPRFARRTFFGRSGCFYRICVCVLLWYIHGLDGLEI